MNAVINSALKQLNQRDGGAVFQELAGKLLDAARARYGDIWFVPTTGPSGGGDAARDGRLVRILAGCEAPFFIDNDPRKKLRQDLRGIQREGRLGSLQTEKADFSDPDMFHWQPPFRAWNRLARSSQASRPSQPVLSLMVYCLAENTRIRKTAPRGHKPPLEGRFRCFRHQLNGRRTTNRRSQRHLHQLRGIFRDLVRGITVRR